MFVTTPNKKIASTNIFTLTDPIKQVSLKSGWWSNNSCSNEAQTEQKTAQKYKWVRYSASCETKKNIWSTQQIDENKNRVKEKQHAHII